MSSPAFNEDDVLPTTETAFSARGEAPRRAGSATSAKSGGGKLVFLGLLCAVILGIAAVIFVKMRPADAAVEDVITTDAPAMTGASEAMPASEAATLFASSVDSGESSDGATVMATPSPDVGAPPVMTTDDVAAIDPVMAAAMPSSVSAQTPAAVAESAAAPVMAPAPETPHSPATSVTAADDALVQRLAALEASIGRLSKQLDGLDRDLNIVESQMPALRAQARQTTPPRTAPRSVAAASAPTAAATSAQAAAPAHGFKLKAVLDGQAWIEGRDGQTYTVAAGDAVDGLGVVVEIDAVRNEVRFPAGVVLGFR